MKNPFHWRGVVTDPKAFIGRTQELQQIFSRIESMNSISVVGRRRIGKSSLLWRASQLICTSVPDGLYYRPIYIDMQAAKHHTLDGLLGVILKGCDGSPKQLEKLKQTTLSEKLGICEELIQEQRGKGIFPVILLDEFEILTGFPKPFGDHLLECWRHLAQLNQLAFVTASLLPLRQVTQTTGLTSSFYNIFSNLKLEVFTEEEAWEYVTWAARVGEFPQLDAQFLLEKGHCDPLRLQVAAWHLFNEKRDGSIDYVRLEDQIDHEVSAMLGKDS